MKLRRSSTIATDVTAGCANGSPIRRRRCGLSLDMPSSGYQWRPERSRPVEYIADFERIGRRALGRPEWKGRRKLFEIYFLHSIEYRSAITIVGVADGMFDYWVAEVKRAAGREFSRTGLFPPSRYFHPNGRSHP